MKNLERYGARERHFEYASSHPELHLARVVSQHKGFYLVATEEEECLAELSGGLRLDAGRLEECPAVGDFVLCDRTDGRRGNAIIHRIVPRSSVFTRKAAGSGHQVQVVAANIDVVFLCMALDGDFNESRLERYLSTAWASGATPVVLLMKADLCDDVAGAVALSESIAPGTEVIAVSRDDATALLSVRSCMAAGTTVSFVGSSGVGKSSLVNALASQDIQGVSATRGDGKGRHTTTARRLSVLSDGCIVVDTPGMRELGVEAVDLSQSFKDIDELSRRCRFRDCRHGAEPGCAVTAAVEEGRLDARRLRNYRKLQREARYDGLTSRQREEEKFDAMFDAAGGMKKARRFIRDNDKRTRR